MFCIVKMEGRLLKPKKVVKHMLKPLNFCVFKKEDSHLSDLSYLKRLQEIM